MIMKGLSFIVTAAVLFAAATTADHHTSSYAVLPYENEIPHQQTSHEVPYNDYNNYLYGYEQGKGKKEFNFGKFMKMPLKALKGAGSYMRGMFKDFKNKFLELNGSIIRAKGNFLSGQGENMIRNAYSSASKGKLLPIHTYYPPSNSYHQPSYTHDLPDIHYKGPAVHDIKYSQNVIHEVPNTIEFDPHVNQGHHGSIDGHKEAHHGHNDGHQDAFDGHILGHQDVQHGHIEDSPSSYSAIPSHRVGLADQEVSGSHIGSVRTDRAYYHGPVVDPGPIPVPVPMAIYPAQLVFPQLNDHHGGYH